jgi:hypothetical protein
MLRCPPDDGRDPTGLTVEIVTGIDPSLPVNLTRMAPPFLGLSGQLGGVQRGCTAVQPLRSFSR